MNSQSKFGLTTIHYERHSSGTEKSETHTDPLVGLTDTDDVDVNGNQLQKMEVTVSIGTICFSVDCSYI